MSKTCFMVISDCHTGHKQGLLNPSSELPDDLPMEGEATSHKVGLNVFQLALWEITETVREWVNENCKSYDKWLIHLGELTQGTEHTDDLLATSMDVQRRLARDTIKPFAEMKRMKGIRLLQATSWHEFHNGSMSKLIADELSMEYKRLDVKAMNQSRMKVGDFVFMWKHHGPGTSKRKYLEGNSVFTECKDRIINYLIEGERVPDVVFTAHTHKPSKGQASILSNGEYVESTQVITPPMCGPGCYSRKVANPEIYYVGMHVVLVDDLNVPKVIPFYTKCKDYISEEL